MKKELTFCDYPDCEKEAETFYDFWYFPFEGLAIRASLLLFRGFGGPIDLCPEHERLVVRKFANDLLNLTKDEVSK